MGRREERKAKNNKKYTEEHILHDGETSYDPNKQAVGTYVYTDIDKHGSVESFICIKRNKGLVPNSIQYGSVYYKKKDQILHGNKLGVDYGLFYHDSLLTDYAGIIELDYMENVLK